MSRSLMIRRELTPNFLYCHTFRNHVKEARFAFNRTPSKPFGAWKLTRPGQGRVEEQPEGDLYGHC